jgi:Holliday junction resolvase RusA-like endonuclease
MIIEFTVPGEPAGKGRPKFTRSGHTYTPKETVNYETMVKLAYRQKYPGVKPVGKDVPLLTTIVAYYKIPASVSNKKRLAMLEGKIRPTKKPDWDNIGKIVCDALNGIAYYDDCQIVDSSVKKFYSDTPRVEVKMEAI